MPIISRGILCIDLLILKNPKKMIYLKNPKNDILSKLKKFENVLKNYHLNENLAIGTLMYLHKNDIYSKKIAINPSGENLETSST